MDDEKLKKQIGANIASYRKRMQLTQAGLAEKLNYSDKAVSKWERGESAPDVQTLVQIADLKKNNDYAMWLKVCKKANCYLLDEELAYYRKRQGSISNHGYSALIKWHYRLFRHADKKNPIAAMWLTSWNLFFGFVKKIKYVKK